MSIRSFLPRAETVDVRVGVGTGLEIVFVNVLGASFTQRLEGSRFVRWQFCSLAAGGSRKRHMMMQFYQLCASVPFRTGALSQILRWVVCGIRLLAGLAVSPDGLAPLLR